MWWKEICDSSSNSNCPPEKTCGGSTGEPVLTTIPESTKYNLRTQYFPDSTYTFDSNGCYYNHATTAAFDFYALSPGGGNTVTKMMRIRRLWQFPSYSPVNPLPDDVYNHEAQVIYTSSDATINTNYGWMMADVVPLNSCAYVVSQSIVDGGSSLTLNFNFEQWVMSIQSVVSLQQRAVVLRQNYAKTFTETRTSTATDTIRNAEKVFWYPYWGAFYWVANGRLILKID